MLIDKDDTLIKQLITKELDEIKVPPVDIQWKKLKEKLELEGRSSTAIQLSRLGRVAILLLIIGSMTFLVPNNALAFREKVFQVINHLVTGKTTENQVSSYKRESVNQTVPEVKDLGANVEKEVTLEEAQKEVPFKLALPDNLPPEMKLEKVIITEFGADSRKISMQYNHQGQVILFSQTNSSGNSAQGFSYDTDDTITKNVTINGKEETLFLSKNGVLMLNWQLRDLVLQVIGKTDQPTIQEFASSIK